MASQLPPDVDRGYRPCVGLMIAAPGRGIFIGRRVGVSGGWQMPQGGIDAGETPEAAAMRELTEETGLADAAIVQAHPDWLNYDLPDWALGRRWRSRWIGQTQKWFLLRYDGPDSSIDLERHQAEFEDWRWAKTNEVLALIVDFKRDVYQRVMDHLAEPADAIVQAGRR
jgi:putative (di)nucleoside polyphosphate hydrolase